MRVTHPDFQRTLLVGLITLALMLVALALPGQLSDANFKFDLPGQSASPPAPVVGGRAPAPPLENPVDSPLMRWMR